MKISEMTNEQAAEAMIRLSGAFSVLMNDEETEAMLKSLDGKTWMEALRGAIPQFVTFALSKHKNELYEIIGALNDVPVAEVGKMNFFQTIESVRNSLDEVLANFFTSSVTATKKGVKESV